MLMMMLVLIRTMRFADCGCGWYIPAARRWHSAWWKWRHHLQVRSALGDAVDVLRQSRTFEAHLGTNLHVTVASFLAIFTHADDSRASKAIIFVCLCVNLFVCLHNYSKTNDPKVFQLGIGNNLGMSSRMYGFGVKGAQLGLGDRVAGMSCTVSSDRLVWQLHLMHCCIKQSTVSSYHTWAFNTHFMCLLLTIFTNHSAFSKLYVRVMGVRHLSVSVCVFVHMIEPKWPKLQSPNLPQG